MFIFFCLSINATIGNGWKRLYNYNPALNYNYNPALNNVTNNWLSALKHVEPLLKTGALKRWSVLCCHIVVKPGRMTQIPSNPHAAQWGLLEPWPAPSWLVNLIGRAPHRYRRGHGVQIPYGPENFFQVLLTTTSFSSVLSCEDLLISTYRSIYKYSIFNFLLHIQSVAQ